MGGDVGLPWQGDSLDGLRQGMTHRLVLADHERDLDAAERTGLPGCPRCKGQGSIRVRYSPRAGNHLSLGPARGTYSDVWLTEPCPDCQRPEASQRALF